MSDTNAVEAVMGLVDDLIVIECNPPGGQINYAALEAAWEADKRQATAKLRDAITALERRAELAERALRRIDAAMERWPALDHRYWRKEISRALAGRHCTGSSA